LLRLLVAPLDAGAAFRQLIFNLAEYALVAIPENGCPEMMDQVVVLAEKQRVENASGIDVIAEFVTS
jgi:hypothetical protein